MAIIEGDKLIKRKQTKRIVALRIFTLVIAVILSACLISISAGHEGAYLKLAGSSIFSILLIAAAWYSGKIMDIEYKYYMEDGILHIDRSFMHYSSKEVFSLGFKEMELVCMEKSIDDKEHKKVKKFDMSSKQKGVIKTVIYFNSKQYGEGKLIFEPNEEIKRSLELFLREKVHL